MPPLTFSLLPGRSKKAPSAPVKSTASAFGMKFPRPGAAQKRNQDPAVNPRPITAKPIEPEAPTVDLRDAIDASYIHSKKRNKEALQKLAAQGYQRDDELSNHNQSVFYHPGSGQLLFSVAGTHNFNDLATDAKLAVTGNARNTKRVKEAKDVYAKAKEKYNPKISKVVGHSLGGYIAPEIAEKRDLVYTYNKASVGDPNHPNEKALRNSWDIVSTMSALNKGTHNRGYGIFNPLEAHSTDALKGKKTVWV